MIKLNDVKYEIFHSATITFYQYYFKIFAFPYIIERKAMVHMEKIFEKFGIFKRKI